MNFGALPPEINSGRMYTGPGAGPMLAAAAAWDGLAAMLYSTASSYGSVLSDLTSAWHGPTSTSMMAAATPYVDWMSATAAQAEQAALQARMAAGAYEMAFAATVPPPVIAANRALLTALIATNFLGQNTPAIAATEAHYAQMWAQDAAAMYGYAGCSATASRLTQFTEPQQITNPSGLAAQSATVAQISGASADVNGQTTLSQLISAVPQALQSLALPTASPAAGSPTTAPGALASSLNTMIGFGTGASSPLSHFPTGGVTYLLGIQGFLAPLNGQNLAIAAGKAVAPPAAASGAPLAGGLGSLVPPAGWGGSAASAGVGNAGLIGKLSVPQGWSMAAPEIRQIATMLATSPQAVPTAVTAGDGSLFSQMALSSLAGRAFGGTAARTVGASASGPLGGVAAAAEPTTATILVIPVLDE